MASTYSPVLSPAEVAGINAARDTNVNNGIPAATGAGAVPGANNSTVAVTAINASNLTPQTPPVYPQVTVPTTSNVTLGSSLAAAAAQNGNIPVDPNATATPDTSGDTDRQSVLNTILGLNTQLGQEGADTTAAQNQYGVGVDTEAVNNLTNQYNAKSQYYDDLTQKAQQNNPLGLSADAITEQTDQISRQKNQELADIAVQQSAANGNLSTATALAKQAVDAKYAPIQAQINTLTQWYQLSENDLSDSEKLEAQANITARQDATDQAAQKDLALYNAQIEQSSPLYKAQVAEANASAAKDYAATQAASNPTITTTDAAGNTISLPSSVAPYYNTSGSGVGYVDASTLQGTAAQKTKIIQDAESSGIKVITNKNEAADLSNIQNVYSNLNTIAATLAGITPPNAASRAFQNSGLTQAAVAFQTSPQRAAAGALSDTSLDILKAISGIQGFRGNSSSIAQVKESLPTIYDDQATVAQKLAIVKQLVENRENAILGQPATGSGASAPTSGTTSSGLSYTVTN